MREAVQSRGPAHQLWGRAAQAWSQPIIIIIHVTLDKPLNHYVLSSNKYLLSIYHVPVTFLDTGYSRKPRKESLSSWSLYSNRGRSPQEKEAGLRDWCVGERARGRGGEEECCLIWGWSRKAETEGSQEESQKAPGRKAFPAEGAATPSPRQVCLPMWGESRRPVQLGRSEQGGVAGDEVRSQGLDYTESRGTGWGLRVLSRVGWVPRDQGFSAVALLTRARWLFVVRPSSAQQGAPYPPHPSSSPQLWWPKTSPEWPVLENHYFRGLLAKEWHVLFHGRESSLLLGTKQTAAGQGCRQGNSLGGYCSLPGERWRLRPDWAAGVLDLFKNSSSPFYKVNSTYTSGNCCEDYNNNVIIMYGKYSEE